MKKILVMALFVLALSTPLMAQAGSTKTGVILGYPVSATIGYHFTDATEINGFIGYSYYGGHYYYSGGLYLGGNFLFTLVNIDIGGEKFPLSLGPQLGVILGYGSVSLEAVADLRFEYTFRDFPLNLFAELGMGVGIYSMGEPWGGVGFAVTGGLGVRYVF
jgi:hypothetical protein